MINLAQKISTVVLSGVIALSSVLAYPGCSTQQDRKELYLGDENRIVKGIEKLRDSKGAELVILKKGFSDKKIRANELYESTAGYSGAQIANGLKNRSWSLALLTDVNQDGLKDLVFDGTASGIKTETGVAVRYCQKDKTFLPPQELPAEGLEKVFEIFE